MSDQPLLQVEHLRVGYVDDDGRETAVVEDVSFRLEAGESLCIVGESGSGKSVTALAVLGLLPAPLEVLSGSIRLRGRELVGLPEREMRAIRGKDVAMVFQDPMTTLNPVRRVGEQLARALRVHRPSMSRADLARGVTDILERVGIDRAAERARAYPHQWSGGMRQRAVIGMAIANEPAVLLADEPTTALDVTVQAQVVDVLAQQRQATGAAMVMITHDLGLVAQVADTVAVMYAGRLVETGSVWDVFDDPRHPYTRGLLASLLTAQNLGQRAYAIPGSPPSVEARPAGCPFEPRCENPAKSAICRGARPPITDIAPGRTLACTPLTQEVTV